MEEFLRLFEHSKKHGLSYFGLLYVGPNCLDGGKFSLWESDSTQNFSLDEEIDINKAITTLESQGYRCTNNFTEFTNFHSYVNEEDHGLLAIELSKKLNKSVEEIIKVARDIPRFYFLSKDEMMKCDNLFYSFLKDLKFDTYSKRSRKRYLGRWLRNGSFIKLRLNNELVLVQTKVGLNGTVMTKEVLEILNN